MKMNEVKQDFEPEAHMSCSIRFEWKGIVKWNHLFFIPLWVLEWPGLSIALTDLKGKTGHLLVCESQKIFGQPVHALHSAGQVPQKRPFVS